MMHQQHNTCEPMSIARLALPLCAYVCSASEGSGSLFLGSNRQLHRNQNGDNQWGHPPR